MGLSGRKEKQRIPDDPRNLTWADDAAKFGQSYLSKLGWDPSKGLGVEGDGRKSHISVSHKLDLLGIGAGSKARSNDPDAIAWRQNKDFENLLARLNAADTVEAEAEKTETETEKDTIIEEAEPIEEKKKPRKEKQSKGEKSEGEKRKRSSEDGEETKEERKKRRTEKKALKAAEGGEEETKEERKKRRKEKRALKASAAANNTHKDEETPEPALVAPIFVPRVRAHRTRVQASKNIATKSAAHIAEILGVAPSSIPSTPSSHQGKLTSASDEKHEKLMTASVSTEDYFRQKLLARKTGSTLSSGASTPTIVPLVTATTTTGLGASSYSQVDQDEAPRRGLGMAFKASAW